MSGGKSPAPLLTSHRTKKGVEIRRSCLFRAVRGKFAGSVVVAEGVFVQLQVKEVLKITLSPFLPLTPKSHMLRKRSLPLSLSPSPLFPSPLFPFSPTPSPLLLIAPSALHSLLHPSLPFALLLLFLIFLLFRVSSGWASGFTSLGFLRPCLLACLVRRVRREKADSGRVGDSGAAEMLQEP